MVRDHIVTDGSGNQPDSDNGLHYAVYRDIPPTLVQGISRPHLLMKDTQYLFVYGTLRKHQNDQSQHPLLDNCNFIGDAFINGDMYEINNYPGAIAGGRGLIKGELYLLLSPEQTLSVLDIYEECASHFPQPHEYIRKLQLVTLPDGQTASAWTYLYNNPTSGLKRILSGDYLNHLKEQS